MAGRNKVAVSLEVGTKRTFAGAIDWPGWCRGGRDQDAALEALFAYAPRYAAALRGTRLGFAAPGDPSALEVAERLKGDATTDFGAPGASPRGDAKPIGTTELRRLESVLRACWRALDGAAESAGGTTLTKGPRGGGRDLPKILEHVQGADAAYLSRLGWKLGANAEGDPAAELDRTRRAVLEALETAVRDGVPPSPRGGKRWTPRSFVRRVAWHTLDHAWEIEDRSA